MRQMHHNSLEAYREVLPKMAQQKKDIINSLAFLKNATMHEIASFMNVPLNTISGRFKSLREDGLIKEVGSTKERRTIWKLGR